MDKIINKFKYLLETKELIRLALNLDEDVSFRQYVEEFKKFKIGADNNINYYKFLEGVNKVYYGGNNSITDEEYQSIEEELQLIYRKLMPIGEYENE